MSWRNQAAANQSAPAQKRTPLNPLSTPSEAATLAAAAAAPTWRSPQAEDFGGGDNDNDDPFGDTPSSPVIARPGGGTFGWQATLQRPSLPTGANASDYSNRGHDGQNPFDARSNDEQNDGEEYEGEEEEEGEEEGEEYEEEEYEEYDEDDEEMHEGDTVARPLSSTQLLAPTGGKGPAAPTTPTSTSDQAAIARFRQLMAQSQFRESAPSPFISPQPPPQHVRPQTMRLPEDHQRDEDDDDGGEEEEAYDGSGDNALVRGDPSADWSDAYVEPEEEDDGGSEDDDASPRAVRPSSQPSSDEFSPPGDFAIVNDPRLLGGSGSDEFVDGDDDDEDGDDFEYVAQVRPHLSFLQRTSHRSFLRCCEQFDPKCRDWNAEFQCLWEAECAPTYDLAQAQQLQNLLKDFDNLTKSLTRKLVDGPGIAAAKRGVFSPSSRGSFTSATPALEILSVTGSSPTTSESTALSGLRRVQDVNLPPLAALVGAIPRGGAVGKAFPRKSDVHSYRQRQNSREPSRADSSMTHFIKLPALADQSLNMSGTATVTALVPTPAGGAMNRRGRAVVFAPDAFPTGQPNSIPKGPSRKGRPSVAMSSIRGIVSSLVGGSGSNSGSTLQQQRAMGRSLDSSDNSTSAAAPVPPHEALTDVHYVNIHHAHRCYRLGNIFVQRWVTDHEAQCARALQSTFRAMFVARVRGVFFPLTSLHTYKGVVVTAQALIPTGGSGASRIVYSLGGPDPMVSVAAHQYLRMLAEATNVRVFDYGQQQLKVPIEAIVAPDTRLYVVNPAGLLPPLFPDDVVSSPKRRWEHLVQAPNPASYMVPAHNLYEKSCAYVCKLLPKLVKNILFNPEGPAHVIAKVCAGENERKVEAGGAPQSRNIYSIMQNQLVQLLHNCGVNLCLLGAILRTTLSERDAFLAASPSVTSPNSASSPNSAASPISGALLGVFDAAEDPEVVDAVVTTVAVEMIARTAKRLFYRELHRHVLSPPASAAAAIHGLTAASILATAGALPASGTAHSHAVTPSEMPLGAHSPGLWEPQPLSNVFSGTFQRTTSTLFSPTSSGITPPLTPGVTSHASSAAIHGSGNGHQCLLVGPLPTAVSVAASLLHRHYTNDELRHVLGRLLGSLFRNTTTTAADDGGKRRRRKEEREAMAAAIDDAMQLGEGSVLRKSKGGGTTTGADQSGGGKNDRDNNRPASRATMRQQDTSPSSPEKSRDAIPSALSTVRSGIEDHPAEKEFVAMVADKYELEDTDDDLVLGAVRSALTTHRARIIRRLCELCGISLARGTISHAFAVGSKHNFGTTYAASSRVDVQRQQLLNFDRDEQLSDEHALAYVLPQRAHLYGRLHNGPEAVEIAKQLSQYRQRAGAAWWSGAAAAVGPAKAMLFRSVRTVAHTESLIDLALLLSYVAGDHAAALRWLDKAFSDTEFAHRRNEEAIRLQLQSIAEARARQAGLAGGLRAPQSPVPAKRRPTIGGARDEYGRKGQSSAEVRESSEVLLQGSLFVRTLVLIRTFQGRIKLAQDDLPQAKYYFDDALSISEKMLPRLSQIAAATLVLGPIEGLLETCQRTPDDADVELVGVIDLHRMFQNTVLRMKPSVQTHALLEKLAALLIDEGEFVAASECLRDAVEQARSIYGDGSKELASCFSLLAVAYMRLDLDEHGDECEQLLEEVVHIVERISGANSVEHVAAINNLGSLLTARNKYFQASRLLHRALATCAPSRRQAHTTATVFQTASEIPGTKDMGSNDVPELQHAPSFIGKGIFQSSVADGHPTAIVPASFIAGDMHTKPSFVSGLVPVASEVTLDHPIAKQISVNIETLKTKFLPFAVMVIQRIWRAHRLRHWSKVYASSAARLLQRVGRAFLRREAVLAPLTAREAYPHCFGFSAGLLEASLAPNIAQRNWTVELQQALHPHGTDPLSSAALALVQAAITQPAMPAASPHPSAAPRVHAFSSPSPTRSDARDAPHINDPSALKRLCEEFDDAVAAAIEAIESNRFFGSSSGGTSSGVERVGYPHITRTFRVGNIVLTRFGPYEEHYPCLVGHVARQLILSGIPLLCVPMTATRRSARTHLVYCAQSVIPTNGHTIVYAAHEGSIPLARLLLGGVGPDTAAVERTVTANTAVVAALRQLHAFVNFDVSPPDEAATSERSGSEPSTATLKPVSPGSTSTTDAAVGHSASSPQTLEVSLMRYGSARRKGSDSVTSGSSALSKLIASAGAVSPYTNASLYVACLGAIEVVRGADERFYVTNLLGLRPYWWRLAGHTSPMAATMGRSVHSPSGRDSSLLSGSAFQSPHSPWGSLAPTNAPCLSIATLSSGVPLFVPSQLPPHSTGSHPSVGSGSRRESSIIALRLNQRHSSTGSDPESDHRLSVSARGTQQRLSNSGQPNLVDLVAVTTSLVGPDGAALPLGRSSRDPSLTSQSAAAALYAGLYGVSGVGNITTTVTETSKTTSHVPVTTSPSSLQRRDTLLSPRQSFYNNTFTGRSRTLSAIPRLGGSGVVPIAANPPPPQRRDQHEVSALNAELLLSASQITPVADGAGGGLTSPVGSPRDDSPLATTGHDGAYISSNEASVRPRSSTTITPRAAATPSGAIPATQATTRSSVERELVGRFGVIGGVVSTTVTKSCVPVTTTAIMDPSAAADATTSTTQQVTATTLMEDTTTSSSRPSLISSRRRSQSYAVLSSTARTQPSPNEGLLMPPPARRGSVAPKRDPPMQASVSNSIEGLRASSVGASSGTVRMAITTTTTTTTTSTSLLSPYACVRMLCLEGHHTAAIQLCEEWLVTSRPADSPSIATVATFEYVFVMQALATAHAEAGHLAEAVPLLKQVIALYHRDPALYGEATRLLDYIGRMCLKNGDGENARAAFTDAGKLLMEHKGTANPHSWELRLVPATGLMRCQEAVMAAQSNQSGGPKTAVKATIFLPDHHIGSTQLDAGGIQAAAAIQASLCGAPIKTHGELLCLVQHLNERCWPNSRLATIIGDLALHFARRKQFPLAAALSAENIKAAKATHGPDSQQHIKALTTESQIYFSWNPAIFAENCRGPLQTAVDILLRIAPSSQMLGSVRNNLGYLHMQQRNFGEARQQFALAEDALKKCLEQPNMSANATEIAKIRRNIKTLDNRILLRCVIRIQAMVRGWRHRIHRDHQLRRDDPAAYAAKYAERLRMHISRVEGFEKRERLAALAVLDAEYDRIISREKIERARAAVLSRTGALTRASAAMLADHAAEIARCHIDLLCNVYEPFCRRVAEHSLMFGGHWPLSPRRLSDPARRFSLLDDSDNASNSALGKQSHLASPAPRMRRTTEALPAHGTPFIHSALHAAYVAATVDREAAERLQISQAFERNMISGACLSGGATVADLFVLSARAHHTSVFNGTWWPTYLKLREVMESMNRRALCAFEAEATAVLQRHIFCELMLKGLLHQQPVHERPTSPSALPAEAPTILFPLLPDSARAALSATLRHHFTDAVRALQGEEHSARCTIVGQEALEVAEGAKMNAAIGTRAAAWAAHAAQQRVIANEEADRATVERRQHEHRLKLEADASKRQQQMQRQPTRTSTLSLGPSSGAFESIAGILTIDSASSMTPTTAVMGTSYGGRPSESVSALSPKYDALNGASSPSPQQQDISEEQLPSFIPNRAKGNSPARSPLVSADLRPLSAVHGHSSLSLSSTHVRTPHPPPAPQPPNSTLDPTAKYRTARRRSSASTGIAATAAAAAAAHSARAHGKSSPPLDRDDTGREAGGTFLSSNPSSSLGNRSTSFLGRRSSLTPPQPPPSQANRRGSTQDFGNVTNLAAGPGVGTSTGGRSSGGVSGLTANMLLVGALTVESQNTSRMTSRRTSLNPAGDGPSSFAGASFMGAGYTMATAQHSSQYSGGFGASHDSSTTVTPPRSSGPSHPMSPLAATFTEGIPTVIVDQWDADSSASMESRHGPQPPPTGHRTIPVDFRENAVQVNVQSGRAVYEMERRRSAVQDPLAEFGQTPTPPSSPPQHNNALNASSGKRAILPMRAPSAEKTAPDGPLRIVAAPPSLSSTAITSANPADRRTSEEASSPTAATGLDATGTIVAAHRLLSITVAPRLSNASTATTTSSFADRSETDDDPRPLPDGPASNSANPSHSYTTADAPTTPSVSVLSQTASPQVNAQASPRSVSSPLFPRGNLSLRSAPDSPSCSPVPEPVDETASAEPSSSPQPPSGTEASQPGRTQAHTLEKRRTSLPMAARAPAAAAATTAGSLPNNVNAVGETSMDVFPAPSPPASVSTTTTETVSPPPPSSTARPPVSKKPLPVVTDPTAFSLAHCQAEDTDRALAHDALVPLTDCRLFEFNLTHFLFWPRGKVQTTTGLTSPFGSKRHGQAGTGSAQPWDSTLVSIDRPSRLLDGPPPDTATALPRKGKAHPALDDKEKASKSAKKSKSKDRKTTKNGDDMNQKDATLGVPSEETVQDGRVSPHPPLAASSTQTPDNAGLVERGKTNAPPSCTVVDVPSNVTSLLAPRSSLLIADTDLNLLPACTHVVASLFATAAALDRFATPYPTPAAHTQVGTSQAASSLRGNPFHFQSSHGRQTLDGSWGTTAEMAKLSLDLTTSNSTAPNPNPNPTHARDPSDSSTHMDSTDPQDDYRRRLLRDYAQYKANADEAGDTSASDDDYYDYCFTHATLAASIVPENVWSTSSIPIAVSVDNSPTMTLSGPHAGTGLRSFAEAGALHESGEGDTSASGSPPASPPQRTAAAAVPAKPGPSSPTSIATSPSQTFAVFPANLQLSRRGDQQAVAALKRASETAPPDSPSILIHSPRFGAGHDAATPAYASPHEPSHDQPPVVRAEPSMSTFDALAAAAQRQEMVQSSFIMPPSAALANPSVLLLAPDEPVSKPGRRPRSVPM